MLFFVYDEKLYLKTTPKQGSKVEMCNLAKYRLMTICHLVVIVAMGLVGCSKTEITQPSAADIAFVIEWPTTKTNELPKTGSIYLYPVSGGSPTVLAGIDGRSSTVMLAEGKYNVVVYNENINAIQLRNNESFSDFEAYLPVKALLDNQVASTIDQADFFYLLSAQSNRQIEIVKGEGKVYTLRPEAATQSFRFEITLNTDIEFNQISGLLTGVASRLNIQTSRAIASDISSLQIPFALSTNNSGTLIASGVVESFGVDPGNRNPGSNVLVLDLVPVVPNDKIKTHYEEDMTAKFDQFNNISLDIKIVVDPPTPDKPEELKITIDVVPWIQEDGGNIDVNPK